MRPGELVFDIGAGEGALTAHLVRAGARVVAVELHPRRVGVLRERFPGITVVHADAASIRCRMWQFITRQASQPLTTRSLPQHAQGACPLAQTAQLTQYDQLHLT